MTSALRISIASTAEQLASLREPWNRLSGGSPFCRWEWLATWSRHYGPSETDNRQIEPLVIALWSQAGELVGLAPWCVETGSGRQRVVRCLGSGEACSEYVGVLAADGWQSQVAEALADELHGGNEQALAGTWDLIELGPAPACDVDTGLLVDALRSRGATVYRRRGPSCWRIDLPRQWDEYLARLSKSHRKQVRRCQERYIESGRARLRLATSFEELQLGLDLLIDLHSRRAQSLGRGGAFFSPRFEAFVREASEQLFAAGGLHLYSLEVDGAIATVEHQLVTDEGVYAYQSGIDPDLLDHQPGRLIMLATIQQAIADGRGTFDFLRGNEPYKAHWRATPVPLETVRILPKRPGARLRHGLWRVQDQLKDFVKSGLRIAGAGG